MHSVYLPAGEVYTTPAAGRPTERSSHRAISIRGKHVDNVTLNSRMAKRRAMTGNGPGYADLKADYNAVDNARKDDFSFVDLGMNPNMKFPAKSEVGKWVPAGTITVGSGSNTWAGGDNTVPYGRSRCRAAR